MRALTFVILSSSFFLNMTSSFRGLQFDTALDFYRQLSPDQARPYRERLRLCGRTIVSSSQGKIWHPKMIEIVPLPRTAQFAHIIA
jgi:hypothetical protein